MNNSENRNRTANISEILGAKEGRYCSSGFRNVQVSFSGITFFEKGLLGKVHVSFRAALSSKGGAMTEPHLGTPEYVATAFLMSETYLQCTLGFSPERIARCWVDRLKLTSSPQTDEDGSTKPVFLLDTTEPAETGDTPEKASLETASLEIKIGHMKLNLRILCPPAGAPGLEAPARSGTALKSFYKGGYKDIDHDILDVESDFTAMTTSGNVHIDYPARRFGGIGSHYFPTMDMTTFVLVSGQLIQVLVYGLDGLSRGETNNMWLRGLEIAYPRPVEPAASMRETVECLSFRKVKMRGDEWRIADLRVTIGNIEAKFNMAHQIKEEHENKNCNIGHAAVEPGVDRLRIVATHGDPVPAGPHDVRMV